MACDWSPSSVNSVTMLKLSYFEAIQQKIVPQLVIDEHRMANGEWRMVRRAAPNLLRRADGQESAGLGKAGVIAASRAEADALQVVAQQLDLHAAPRAVGPRVSGDVAERIARRQLLADLVEHALEVFRDRGEKCLAAGCLRGALQLAPLLHPAAARLMLEISDRIHGYVRGFEQVQHVPERQRARRVAAVGVEHEHLLAVLILGAVQ